MFLAMVATPRSHPVFARFYAQVTPLMDRELGDRRVALLDGLHGTVLEVGAGTGANFPRYPSQVTRVVAVEPEPHLRRLATAAASDAPVAVEVVDGTAERLPADAGTFDAVVVSLVLCSVQDPTAALGEAHRVMRPGGQLRFLEHVRADTPGLRRLQRLLDATIWPALMGGCHPHRDTTAAIAAAGFRIDRLDRFMSPPTRMFPTSPHVIGTASRTAPQEQP